MFCPICGAQLSDGALFCPACGTPTTQQPATPSVAQQAPPPPVPSHEPGRNLASLGDRFLAAVLDTLLFIALFAALGMAVARRFGGITAGGFSFDGTPAAISIGATLLLAFLYYWLCEGLFGATLGKAMLGLRVRLKDGSACGMGPSLTRNLLRLIDAIAVYLVGFLVAILSKHRQRLGDHAAGTIVTTAQIGPLARSSLVLLWALCLFGGLAGAYLLHRGAPVTSVPNSGGKNVSESAPAASGLASVTFSTTGALKLKDFAFLQTEDGLPRPPAPFASTDKVHLKYDIEGFSTGAGGRPRLLYEISAYDPAGLLLHTPWKNEFTRSIESGSPVHGTFSLGLPRAVPSGLCKIVIKVRDELNNSELTINAPFEVQAPPLAPAANLEIRDFELALSEDGPAIPAVELPGGGSFFMRCNVFGMKFDGDQANVRMSVRLIGPGGRVVFEKPDYGSISDTWVYHPPTFHVPVSGNLTLPGNSEKGAYKVVYSFADIISGQNATAEGRVEVK
jgi:uncharacterized RDD family membrane protein YckC